MEVNTGIAQKGYDTVATSAPKPLSAANHSGSSPGKIMSASEISRMHFKTIGLQGKYRKLIGDPEPGFAVMIYGKPKSGKSTMAIDFAKELAKGYGKTLYCALEEGFGLTLKSKIERMGAGSIPNLHFADKMPASFAGYNFAFIDSVSEIGMDPDTLKNLRAINLGTSIITVHHTTKQGNFRGSQQAAHDVDVMIEVAEGVANAKGRFGPPAEMIVSQGSN